MYQPTVGRERFYHGGKTAFQRPLSENLHHVAGVIQRGIILLATDGNSKEISKFTLALHERLNSDYLFLFLIFQKKQQVKMNVRQCS